MRDVTEIRTMPLDEGISPRERDVPHHLEFQNYEIISAEISLLPPTLSIDAI